MRLEVQNGSFSYPRTSTPVFEKINFAVDSGEIMTILGHNGVGKTTLVKCLTGIMEWSDGCVRIDGKEASKSDDKTLIAYVPQSHTLTFPYSVHDIVLMGRTRLMGALSIPSKEDSKKADEVLSEMGLSDLAQRRCDELSGGQLQMVFIARALASEPKVLVMDEPESALDFKNQFRLLKLVVHLARSRSIACIINTHYPDHALEISDKTLLMGDGKYLFGPTSDIIVKKNMDEYFHVKSEIATLQIHGKSHKSFVVYDG